MIAQDLQPFSMVEDSGFRTLAQHFINVGARHGSLSIDDILFDRTTLAGIHLKAEYTLCQTVVSDALKKLCSLVITTDHWSDDMVKKHQNSVWLRSVLVCIIFQRPRRQWL
jgi:hypothetical protein